MQAGIYNIRTKKSRFYSVQVYAKAYVSGSTTVTEPVDLTGYTATGSIRIQPSSPQPTAKFRFSGSFDTSGSFYMQLYDADTTNLEAREYYYDVKLVDTANRAQDFLEGSFLLVPNVTR